MRICVLLFALLLIPGVGVAQLANRPDSAGLARAMAKAIQAPIKKNGAPRAAIVTAGTIEPLSKAWNAQLDYALKTLDSSLVTRRPTNETLRINVVKADMIFGDSAAVNIAMSRCYAERFVGSSVDYSFKRRGTEWVIVHQQPGFAARGPCPKK